MHIIGRQSFVAEIYPSIKDKSIPTINLAITPSHLGLLKSLLPLHTSSSWIIEYYIIVIVITNDFHEDHCIAITLWVIYGNLKLCSSF